MTGITEKDKEALLKALNGAIQEESQVDEDDVGTDLIEVAKQLTSDINAFRFSNVQKMNVPLQAMMMVMSERPEYYKLPYPRPKGRYWVMARYVYWQAIIAQAIKSGMADRYKDLGGYLLAYKGGIEWREAGIGDALGMDEKKMGLLQRLKK